MMKGNEEIPNVSDAMEGQPQQQHHEIDAPRPSVGKDDRLVSDYNKPSPGTSAVSSGHGAAIISPNTFVASIASPVDVGNHNENMTRDDDNDNMIRKENDIIRENNQQHLIPEGKVQILEDHQYASTQPESHPQTSMKQYIKQYWFTVMLIMMIFFSITSVCVTGNCFCPDRVPEIIVTYRSFETKEELMNAVDNFVSGQNMTPSLEETYGPISQWNVSQIQDFSYLFARSRNKYNQQFNEDISRWDVSSATNMSHMFWKGTEFRGDLSKWNVARVTDMSRFMAEVIYFNSNLSQWDTSRLENAFAMFDWATSFEGIGLECWNVSNVYNMSRMFFACDSFHGNVSTWDVSNVMDMSETFAYTNRYDGNLSSWDVSHVRDTSWMFQGASSFRGVGLANWDTKKIVTMNGMFFLATSFDDNLSLWDVSNVIDTHWMFYGASSFRGVGVENWDTSKIEDMSIMFDDAISFDGNLSSWNVSKVKDTSYMFHGASSFHGIGLERWDTSNIETMQGMFQSATSFDNNLSSWDVSKVSDMSLMFHDAISFHGHGVDVWNVSQVNNTAYMFDSAISFHADLSRWNISHIENANDMFTNVSSFSGVFWWDNTTASLTS